MVYNLTDFYLNSNVEFSLHEEIFKTCAKKLYGISIHQTCLVKGAKNQRHLYIWADLAEDGAQRHREIRLPSDCTYSEKDVIALYFNSFDITLDDRLEVYLHLYDFQGALLSYAYGNGIADLRERIKATSLWKNAKVYLDYTKHMYCVVYDGKKRSVTKEEHQELLNLCLSVLKLHDHHYVVRMSDVRLTVIHESDTNTREWNDVFMTN